MSRKRRQSKKPSSVEPEAKTADQLSIDKRFVASRELFDRARSRVTVADVERYAPNDPCYLEYVAAFEDILLRGEAALSWKVEVTETIALTRWTAAPAATEPMRFRWFRILTCAAEILVDQSESPNYSVAVLLMDSFALAEAGDDEAPTDLLSAVCREIQASPLASIRAKEHAFCILGELLLSTEDGLDPAAIEALCAALEARDRRYHQWWMFEEGQAADELWSDAFLWSLADYDQLHPVWLDLVAARFPVDPPAAAAMKQRLLNDGALWRHLRRPMS